MTRCTGEVARTPQGETFDPARWRALAVCLVVGFMTLLDISIVNVALPSIQSGLHAGPEAISWVRAGYTLSFGLVLVPAGKLGDALGRKRMFLAGLFLFTVVSLLCAVAPSPTGLVVARLLQGAAAGLLNPQIIGMIQHFFRGSERGRAFGLYGATVAVATAIGPLAGGLLIQAGGWRCVFLINVPIGVLALALGLPLIPKSRPRKLKGGLDLVGVVLLGGGITSIMLPLIEQEQGAGSVRWWLLGLAAVLLGGFIAWEKYWQRSGHEPLVELSLLRSRSFSASSILAMAYFAGYPGVLFILSLYLQQGRGYSALAAGATGMPFAIGSAITATISGRYVYRIGRRLVTGGLTAVALGLAATAIIIRYHHDGTIWLDLLAPLLLAGLGSGLVIGPNQTLALQYVAPAVSGTAAAMVQTGQRVGMSLGTAIAATMFFSRLTGTRHNYPNAASYSLYGATALVGAALVIGIADLILSHRAQR